MFLHRLLQQHGLRLVVAQCVIIKSHYSLFLRIARVAPMLFRPNAFLSQSHHMYHRNLARVSSTSRQHSK